LPDGFTPNSSLPIAFLPSFFKQVFSYTKGEIEMNQIEFQPLETSGAGEGLEQAEAQKLDDVTFEPRSFVEQNGNYQQAEAIQTGFTALVDTITNPTIEQSGVTPLPIPRTSGEYTSGEKQVGDCPIPIPSPAGEYTGEQVGTCPIPIPSPVEEIGQKYSLAGTTEVAETPLPAPSGESGNKEEVGTLPVPLPRPADGMVITPINLPDVQNTAGVEIGMDPNPVYMPKNEATSINLPGAQGIAGEEIGNKNSMKGMTGVAETPLPGTVGEIGYKEQAGEFSTPLPVAASHLTGVGSESTGEEILSSVGDDAQLADIDLQNVLEKQQQIVEMLSRLPQSLSDMALGVIRNMK
jgi:hypothetical protein